MFHTALIILLLSSSIAQEKTVDRVIAVVNNQAITLSALENQLIIEGAGNPSPQKRREALEKLIERKLFLQEAERWGIPLERWKDKVKAEIQEIQSK